MRIRLVEEAKKHPLLQIALDFTNLDEAIKIAKKVIEARAHIIEIGTPLVKTYGILALDRIKNEIRNNLIVVDLKTIDATELEFSTYLNKGVDGITLLGIVDEDVVQDAIALCRKSGVALIVDMIYVPNPVNKALRLAELGVDVIAMHVGVDIQKKRGITAKELLKEISEISASGVIVMVAGGIKPHEVNTFVSYGARIIVIGSAITKSPDPYKTTLEALNTLIST